MKTPQEKYESDPAYKQLVDTLETLVHDCAFSPSEVREAATLASIHFEMKNFTRYHAVPTKIHEALKTLIAYREEGDTGDE